MSGPQRMGGWRLDDRQGLRIARHEALLAVPGVGHAFSTRWSAGRADFDLGAAGPQSSLVEERRQALLRAAGLADRQPAILRQVHGTEIVRLSGPSVVEPEADGALALREDRVEGAPAVRTADCVPILIVDRRGGAVAAVHAGWRGTAGGIAAGAVALLGRAGVPPERLIALLGPAVGPCCYEVSVNVLDRVAAGSGVPPQTLDRAAGGGRPRLDLGAANRVQLTGAGVPESAVHTAPWCTFCESDLFFSYRRDGSAAGRQMACVGWIGPAP